MTGTVLTEALEHLLARCTVRIYQRHPGSRPSAEPDDADFAGTGFFVLPDTVLTCAHVLRIAGHRAEVRWQDGGAVSIAEELLPAKPSGDLLYDFPDLGVLHLRRPADRTFAWLADRNPESGRPVFVRGFTAEALVPGVHPTGLALTVAAPQASFLRVKEDQVLRGLSGSPVLDAASGQVCGMVKATIDPGSDLGGLLTPASAIAESLPDLVAANNLYPETAARWWAASLPDEFGELMRAQEVAAERTPYDIAPEVNLARVYVRQHLSRPAEPEGEGQPAGPSPESEGEGQPAGPSPEPAVYELEEALAEYDYIFVTGGPGQGKSTQTLGVAAERAHAWLEHLTRAAQAVTAAEPLPPPPALRVTARGLAACQGRDWPQALAAAAAAELGAVISRPVPPDLLRARGPGLLVLVDGLDEIAEPQAHRWLLRDLIAWKDNPGLPHKLLVTTRPMTEYDTETLRIAGFVGFALKPFDAEALRHFARSWFTRSGGPDGDRLAQQYLAEVERARLTEVTRVPLLATVAAELFEAHPDQPLPRNRYELYEGYIDYLLVGRGSESVLAQWQQLEARLAVLPRGAELAAWLQARLDKIVVHLAKTSLKTEDSLIDSVRDWVDRRAGDKHLLPQTEPRDWNDILGAAVTTRGVLIRRGGDLQFLHRSFAEHLAARSYAAELPDNYDPENKKWCAWVHRARHDYPPQLAHTVLAAHTRRHPRNGLFAELQSHPHTDLALLAAELLAYGASPETADDAVVEGVCASLHAWLSSPETNEAVFDRALTAAATLLDHAGVLGLLTGLSAYGAVRPDRGLQVAYALAQNGPTHGELGITVLREVAARESEVAGIRLSAARFLADLGPEFHREADEVFRGIATGDGTDAFVRIQAGSLMVGLGPEAHQCGVEVLLTLVADRETRPELRAQAASTLADLGPGFVELIAAALVKIAADETIDVEGRISATQSLIHISPAHQEQAVSTLRGMLAGPSTDPGDQILAAQALFDLGSLYRVESGDALLAIAKEQDNTTEVRHSAAALLFWKFRGRYGRTATKLLERELRDSKAAVEDRIDAGACLIGTSSSGPDVRREVIEVFLTFAGDASIDMDTRVHAATTVETYAPAKSAAAADLARTVRADRRLRLALREQQRRVPPALDG